MSKYAAMIGKTFGKLLITGRVEDHVDKDGRKRAVMSCECSCGSYVEKVADYILAGYTKSCGCLKKEAAVKKLQDYRKGNSVPWNKLDDRIATLTRTYALYKRGAERRDYAFDLTLEQFENIITQDCYYCGEPPNTGNSIRSFKINGMDRKVNRLGYTLANSVPCCSVCNKMKSILTEYEFLTKVKEITRHQETK